MRFFLSILLMVGLLLPGAAYAQADGWCGYALIEGLPIARNQIGILELLTPPRTRQSQPDELFQFRYSLDGKKVLIEGCWRVDPSRQLIGFFLESTGIDPLLVNQQMIFSLFAPGRRREDSAASVRLYLQQHAAEWVSPDEGSEDGGTPK